MDALPRLNSLPPEEARAAFLRCCGSRRWAEAMTSGRPFRGERELFEAAGRAWRELGPQDWIEAFGHHPPIGDTQALGAGASASSWAKGEQSLVRLAGAELLDALAEGNRAYQAKFGYIFIVCATGKTAEEMLSLLRERMKNEPQAELRAAAEEQLKITRIRLEKLLEESREVHP